MERAVDKVTFVNPEGLYDSRPNAYTHVVVVPGNSKLIYVSGQGGETADGKLVNDFRTQLKQAFSNLTTALASQGLTLRDVVKQTTLIVNHDHAKLDILKAESALIWPDQKFPANTLIPVPALALEGMLVEIDVTAVSH